MHWVSPGYISFSVHFQEGGVGGGAVVVWVGARKNMDHNISWSELSDKLVISVASVTS